MQNDELYNELAYYTLSHKGDKAIHKWCASIWESFSSKHKEIIEHTESLL